MSLQNPTSNYTKIADTDMEAFRRVNYKAGDTARVVYADDSDNWIGITQTPAKAGRAIQILDRKTPGTHKCEASAAIAAGEVAKCVANGRVGPNTGLGATFGTAERATTADGDIAPFKVK